MLPPLWFTGVYATLEGHTLVDTRIVVPPRLQLPPWMTRQNETASYRRDDPLFHELAGKAFKALWLAAAAAILGFAWNSPRLPLPTTRPLRVSQLRRSIGRRVARMIAPRPAARAGFSFTLQALMRSTPHRVAMSAALAFGLTASIVLAQAFRGVVASSAAPDTLPQPGVFAAQFAVVAALVGGFRHAVRLPATLAANWAIQIAWRGDQRMFMIGCRRAAMVALIAAPLAVLLPAHVALVGWRIAVAHAAICGVAGVALLDGLFVRFNRVALASPYVPLVSPKVLWPASVAGLFAAPWMLGVIERVAFGSAESTLLLMIVLASIGAAVNYARTLQRSGADAFVFDDPPATTTQRLGLQDRVIG